jgi:hypothetical protein
MIEQCPIDKLFIFLPVIWNDHYVVMLLVFLWLMFCVPCIIAYLCHKVRQGALFTSSFIPINNLYMLREGLLLIDSR